MLILASTTDKIRLVTGSAGSVMVHASWMDNIAGAISPGRTNTPEITTATTTDIVGSPTGTNIRAVKTLAIHNHGTTMNTVTVQHTDGTTTVDLHQTMLGAQETLSYIDEVGFRHVPASGDDGAGRVLLYKTVPAAVAFFDVPVSVLSNTNFDIFEVDWQIGFAPGAPDDHVCGRFSVDGGATYPSTMGIYHIASVISSSGNSPGWNAVQGGGASQFLFGYQVGAASGGPQRATGSFRIYQGDPQGFTRVIGDSVAWTNTNSIYQAGVHFWAGAWGLAGRATNLRVFSINGGVFLTGAPYYFKIYGIK